MPDVALMIRGLAETGDAGRLEQAIERVEGVETVSVNAEKELLAVSYEGGEAELERIEQAARDAGFEIEPTPGAKNAGG